jgi:hypothetical protein
MTYHFFVAYWTYQPARGAGCRFVILAEQHFATDILLGFGSARWTVGGLRAQRY